MGSGIAESAARAGLRVISYEPERAALERSRAAIAESVSRAVARGKLEAAEAQALQARIEPTTDLEALDDCDIVVEAILEDPQIKGDLFERLDALLPADRILASNTSSIPIAQLAARLRRPDRFLGVHWFVPPLLVPCVEVIPSSATSAGVVEKVVGTLRQLGKAAVAVGDGPGFVANRIQFAMFREAARIVEDGLATPEQVDEVVRSSFGFRLPFFGPFTIADMAGLDVYSDVFETLERSLGPGFAAPAILREHVDRGELGVKAGRGFLELSQSRADELIDRRDRAYVALAGLRRELEG